MMQKQFRLKHEAYYTHHPNLTQHFVPITDAEFQERLERHRGEIAIMLRSSEFNQDKTTLIVTNNPLPLLITGQHLSTSFQFFSKGLSGSSIISPPSSYLPPLRTTQNQLTAVAIRKLKKKAQLRFATDKDFSSEAQFSRSCEEKRLQNLYPNLRTYSRPDQQKAQRLPSIQSFGIQASLWEPLTLSCLTETKPTIGVPGEDGFRYGKAPLWIVNSSVVSRGGK